jgi:hypothetical protein
VIAILGEVGTMAGKMIGGIPVMTSEEIPDGIMMMVGAAMTGDATTEVQAAAMIENAATDGARIAAENPPETATTMTGVPVAGTGTKAALAATVSPQAMTGERTATRAEVDAIVAGNALRRAMIANGMTGEGIATERGRVTVTAEAVRKIADALAMTNGTRQRR